MENVVTFEPALSIEASNVFIKDSIFRKVKSKSPGGVILQKYSVDDLQKFRDFFITFYGNNLFEETYSERSGGAIALTYGSRMDIVNGTIIFRRC
jgi:hypothetical protein